MKHTRFMVKAVVRRSVGIKRLIFNTIVIMACVGVLFVVSENTSFVRRLVAKVVNTPSSQVLGTNVIEVKDADKNPSDELKKDVEQQVETLKKQSMHIKVSDVVDTTTRVQRILHDVQSLQLFVGQTIKSVTKFIP